MSHVNISVRRETFLKLKELKELLQFGSMDEAIKFLLQFAPRGKLSEQAKLSVARIVTKYIFPAVASSAEEKLLFDCVYEADHGYFYIRWREE